MEETKNKGGRPKGSLNKRTLETIEKARQEGILPHEFLLKVVRGEAIIRKVVVMRRGLLVEEEVVEQYDFADRLDAAGKAAPYYAPKISTVEVISGISDEDLNAIIKSAAAEAGIDLGTYGESPQGEDQGDADSGVAEGK